MASLGMVLEGYSDDVICYITDPKTGIQRKSKWPPTISEIVEACNERAGDLARQERFRNWGRADALMLEGPQEERPTLDELKAKYGDNWGLTSVDEKPKSTFKAPSAEQLAAHYAKHGLAFQKKESA